MSQSFGSEAPGFSMPAEWEPHARTLMAWPCRLSAWGDAPRMERARNAFARVAQDISAFEPVTMIARPEDAKEAERMCGRDIEIMPMPIDDSWMRDTGPIFLTRGEGLQAELMGTHWGFNGWGEKFRPYDNDGHIPTRLLHQLEVPYWKIDFVLEGGSIASDGEGTLYTTTECLLNPNRNPGFDDEEVTQVLCDVLGAERVVWLPWGLEDDETDGHIDNCAALGGPGRMLLNWTNDPDDLNTERMAANRVALALTSDARDRQIEVIEMPQPLREAAWNGHRLPLSYLNFYVCNGAVIAPSFNDPLDLEARRILASAFPKREIVQVPARDIVQGGGGIHCITQQVPAALPAEIDE